jgi:probable F420-dependent oxidoreductase
LKFDANLPPSWLKEVPQAVRAAEQLGFDAIWTSETSHNPFLPHALAAIETKRIRLGTSVAIGFARSPGALAYEVWDLAQASDGRFILGMGTQVRAHIERRFGMPWPESPVGKLGEMIQAMRAVWEIWQSGGKMGHRGQHFKLTLMTPFFNPGPIEHPQIPIYIAGVNRALCRLAGEVANGFMVHPYHSPQYLKSVIRPSIAEGARRAERDPGDIVVVVPAFTVTSDAQADFVRSQISFYASTPSYRPVMESHGWGEFADELQAMARGGKWSEMAELIDDEMLAAFAVVCAPEDLATSLKDRYSGLADRLSIYTPFIPGEQDEFWVQLIADLGEDV